MIKYRKAVLGTQEHMGWVTLRDLDNNLVVHISQIVDEYLVDAVRVDPDGLPLVYFKARVVTRVRKMTEEEYNESMAQYIEEMKKVKEE